MLPDVIVRASGQEELSRLGEGGRVFAIGQELDEGLIGLGDRSHWAIQATSVTAPPNGLPTAISLPVTLLMIVAISLPHVKASNSLPGAAVAVLIKVIICSSPSG